MTMVAAPPRPAPSATTPPEAVSYRPAGTAPSLVSEENNSSIDCCPNGALIKGWCLEHFQYRWTKKPCGRRDCEVCGPLTRSEIASRIAYGVHVLWPCAWMVLTFKDNYYEVPNSKSAAIRKLGGFIKWLRKRNPQLEYVATYELTKRGRLHINLICGP